MKSSAGLYNGLAALLLGMTVVACLCTAVVFVNPNGLFDVLKTRQGPLSALTQVTPIVPPTDTPSPVPTSTPSPTPTPGVSEKTAAPDTPTPGGTKTTPTSTAFPTPVGPTATEIPTEFPTRTRTPRPPPATATSLSYPGQPTSTPPPGGYP